ncbi:MAG: sulfite exporter TauE/SafE family protein [Anaerolineae bacterium]|nr:MAG: sulfite exporter TauE/SafE family protein [Anaerolineae bacterium]
MLAVLVLAIFVLSILFSMLGLGGALVYNPLMVWFGYDFKEVVVSTGLLLNGLTALSAAWVYYRKGLIDFSIGLPLTLAAMLGAPVGAWFTRFVPTTTLMWLFSLVVIVSAWRMLRTSGAVDPETVRGTHLQRALLGSAVGFVVGALAGLLGIGGGFLFVPLLIFLGYPTKVAAATTALAVVFSSFSGLAGHLAAGHVDWQLMTFAGLAVVLGSQIGARLMTERIPAQTLKRLFGGVLLLIALKLVWGLI